MKSLAPTLAGQNPKRSLERARKMPQVTVPYRHGHFRDGVFAGFEQRPRPVHAQLSYVPKDGCPEDPAKAPLQLEVIRPYSTGQVEQRGRTGELLFDDHAPPLKRSGQEV